ncbi:hypothetical protein OY671_010195, partial [Metschnikowia pulcherrima]
GEGQDDGDREAADERRQGGGDDLADEEAQPPGDAAQAAARAAAAANGTDVPDGSAPGGLWVAEGASAKWEGAKAPKPGVEGGRQSVTIEQTQSRAISSWDTFNSGRNTPSQFKQGADDAVSNRVVGASARPSQISGAIQADGTVMVVNQ